MTYGQQADESDREKDKYYRQLEEMIKETSKKNDLIIVGGGLKCQSRISEVRHRKRGDRGICSIHRG